MKIDMYILRTKKVNKRMTMLKDNASVTALAKTAISEVRAV